MNLSACTVFNKKAVFAVWILNTNLIEISLFFVVLKWKRGPVTI